MTELTTTFSKDEVGWVTEPIELEAHGCIYLDVELEGNGYLVVKQWDDVEKAYPKVLVSSRCRTMKVRLHVPTEGARILILTSEEPKRIRYDYI